MRRGWAPFVAVLLSCVFLPAGPVAAATVPPISQPPIVSNAGEDTSSLQPPVGEEGGQRADSRLTTVIATARSHGTAAALGRAQQDGLTVEAGAVRVVVEASDAKAARAAVAASGAKLEGSAGDLIQVTATPGQLAGIVGARGVSYVRPPLTRRAVAVDGEGVASTNAVRFQLGATGAGVKVAVIDLGFQGLAAAQASGDLPSSLTTQDFCGGAFDTATEHGTAVAEIVHEMAPDAQLYLLCVDTEVDLADAEAYAKANGITIVNHSVAWFDVGRGDGSGGPGSPDATVADARANGILWVNAAGNYATEHWSGKYSDYNDAGNHWNKFRSSPVDLTNSFLVYPGSEVCALLKWDAWPSTTQDFDLYIGRASDRAWIGISGNAQYPLNLPPVEEVCVTNPGGAIEEYFVAIYRRHATTTPRMDLFVLDADLEHQTAAGSLADPASSPSAFAAGAVAFNESTIEEFSSRGPTIDGRVKPDISGPDGVSGTTYGHHAFYGTSAASPHVAGAAALVKSLHPSYSPAQLRAYLTDRATDLGTAGKDSTYGAGLLHLPGPPTEPTGVTATAYDRSAAVSWTPPASSGGETVSGYTVTASPGGATCSTTGATSCTVDGLTNGVAYSFTVVAVNAVGTGDESTPSAPVTPSAVPAAPVVSATFASGGVHVTWTAPDAHGSPITNYHMTATGGSFACDTTSLSCDFGPVAATFTGRISVTAANGNGTGPAGTFVLTGRVGDSYVALTPNRILDTAASVGSILAPASMGKLSSGVPVEFAVTDRAPGDADRNVPSNAVAVTGVLRVSNLTSKGFLALTPAREVTPGTSTLNFPAGDARATGITVPLSGSGTLWVVFVAPSGNTADVAFDLTGYFVPGANGATYHGLTPNRIVDSRPTGSGHTNAGMKTGLTAGVPKTFTVTGRVPADSTRNVPAGAVAVVGNLTVTAQSAPGSFSVQPYPDDSPDTAMLRFPVGDNRATGLTLKLAPDGTVSITFTSSTDGAVADVVFDVTGYFGSDTSGAMYVPVTPNRIVDSRINEGISGALRNRVAATFWVINRTPSDATTNVPTGAVAVTGTLTVTKQTYLGWLALTTSPNNSPTVSTLNFPVGDNRATGVTVPLSSTGKLSVTYGAISGATTHVVFDVSGYFIN